MEYEEFKHAFFAGDLIWFKNVKHQDEGAVREVLERLRVRSSCVEMIDMEQALKEGIEYGLASEVEVRVVRLEPCALVSRRLEFIRFLSGVLELQKGLGFRILLVSGDQQEENWVEDLRQLMPRVFEAIPRQQDLMNDSVHELLEIASGHAQVRVARLSERAAYFLEELAKSKVDAELVALVVLGLRRCDGRVLRFRDLLPHFHQHFERGGQGETV